MGSLRQDEVLGALVSGVDFERRNHSIYQMPFSKEIDDAFGQLQLELDETISKTMSKAQQKVLENLDEEVHQRLKLREDEAIAIRSSQERALYFMSKHLLGHAGKWNDGKASFSYKGGEIAFARRRYNRTYYRVHILGQELITRVEITPRAAELTFIYTATGDRALGIISGIGWMQVEV
jgi:mRNA-degrading endonuclease RelE of RelBE toxin-antitoxin system